MCYFSDEGRSRNSRQGEVLVVRRQSHGTKWLVSPDDTSTAVCLKEGTEVELLYIPEHTQRQLGLPRETIATFKLRDWWRCDVFLFRNGRKAPLKKLQAGQVVRVLSGQVGLDQKEFPLEEERIDMKAEPSRNRVFP